MAPPLLSLPSEVLIEIFSYLHPRDIAACQDSCRQLNDTVSHSQLLRYLVRAWRAGLHDPLFPGYTIRQRIEALEKWEATWSNLEMVESSCHVKHIVPCENISRTHCIHDDFLILIHGYSTPGYAYVDLRTFQPEMEKDPWTTITNDSWRYKIRDFVFSVEQDLALVIIWPTLSLHNHTGSVFIELHGVSFSRGTPHPSVVRTTIPTKRTHEFVDSVIVSDRTILNISSPESQRIYLHSWKDGHVYLLREAPKVAWSRYGAILSRDMIALIETDSATLELCRIVEESDGGAPSLITLVCLGLPPLAPGISVLNSQFIQERVPAYSDAPSLVIEGRPPRRFPFHNSTEQGLVAIITEVSHGSWPQYNVRYFKIVTHLRTLVALATRTSSGVTFIPWENWGPRVTACFDDPVHRYALMGERLTITNDKGLSLLDFNSSRIRDTIRRSGNSAEHSVHVTKVKHRSVIPQGNLFREDVIGELPYISVVRPVPLFGNLANYEEGLAGLSWDNTESYVRVYTTE